MSSLHAPRYQHIADTLRDRVDSGELVPGDRLPSETALAAEFGVARITARQALDILRSEGLIESKRGRNGGTFIRADAPLIEMTRMDGYLPQLRERGHTVESQVLVAKEIAASETVARALDIEVGNAVYNIRRLRSIRDKPVILENSYFPKHRVPTLLNRDLSQSIYELLARLGRAPVDKSEEIVLATASTEEKRQMRVSQTTQLLRILRIARDATREAVEYSEDLMRFDSARILVRTGPEDVASHGQER
ncbi:GntR family transcriptional regulator [Auritidibacter ignavus]|uniref:GntR family transcriptional regulator n=1 Tax=Auritidibacter ignavus TaxID=678932 RepID=A0AAJ6DDK7_9MICC|nr:GntR family transcriptional regulator [Auritidibacter ignavus]PXA79187.1 GntR family transcriptional regulator [Auritidibacter sp. NML120779]WGH91847.1 GntR family transcriptional regulator [Auritidibacter ignavus]WGH94321.1 GntR family transcriptional regulator [Auritidibacter ignavus]